MILIGVFVLCFAWLGTQFSRWWGEKEEQRIWKSGKEIPGTIIGRGYMKGDYIRIAYQFGIQRYEDKNWDHHYTDFPVGTKLLLMVDTTYPDDYFIMDLDANSVQLIEK